MTGVFLVLMMIKTILLFISLLSLVTSSLLPPRRGGALGQFLEIIYLYNYNFIFPYYNYYSIIFYFYYFSILLL